MSELSNHLAARAMLNQQGILAADLRASCHVGDFNQQAGLVDKERRNAAVHRPFGVMHLGWCEAHFVCVMIPGREHPGKDVSHFRFVVDKLEQRLAARAPLADAEDVFCRRIQSDDKEMVVEQNDARA